MKRALMAVAAAGVLAVSAVAAPAPAHGWWPYAWRASSASGCAISGRAPPSGGYGYYGSPGGYVAVTVTTAARPMLPAPAITAVAAICSASGFWRSAGWRIRSRSVTSPSP